MKSSYFLKRLCLIPFTLFSILLFNFMIIQFTPGGPIEQVLSRFQNFKTQETGAVYQKTAPISQEIRQELIAQFGFDKPASMRFMNMVKNYLKFDFGKSFYQNKTVIELIKEKLPVSISLGLFSTLLIYFIAIPLGIKKAIQNGSKFDKTTHIILSIFYAIPAFLLALMFIIFFASKQYFNWFYFKGLVSNNFDSLSFFGKIKDYFLHITLPVLSLSLGSLASLCFLTKNSFLAEMNKEYVLVAKAKGLSQNKILYHHIFKNAMIVVLSGLPSAFVGMFLSGSILIEIMFSLDGLGYLGFEALQNRDYPIIFGTLYLFSLLGLILNLITDLLYLWIDPKIHFEKGAKR